MKREARKTSAARRLVLIAATALGLGLTSALGLAAEGVDPQADQVLRSMSSYLGGLAAFTVKGDVDDELIDLDGQKIQLSASATLAVERPSRFHAHRKGPVADIEAIFDGETLTLHGKRLNVYTQIAAEGTIDDALNRLRTETGLDAPAGDLFFADPYPGLMTDVRSGAYLGTAYVGGVECHHLAFRAAKVDWQIWVQTGDQPLPMKYVITSKWITGAPAYSVRFRDWDTAPKLDPAQFRFATPEGARRLETILADELGALMIEEKP
jgi:hypothetical protein